jgi:hypothetical protein
MHSFFRLVKMTALGIALIVCGLTIVCASMIFLLIVVLTLRREPSSPQESFEQGPFQIHDEMWRDQDAPIGDSSAPAEQVPNDRERRDE